MSLLTQSNKFLIGPVAVALGWVMAGLFWLMSLIGISNIGLAIILFTFVILMAMLPLTYRQQKFSRMTPLMQPELNAIQKKYKGKTDQVSMQKMNDETKMVYAKYGVNPAGSCVQMAISMLVLFPLYNVIMNVPAYVPAVKRVFEPLASALLKAPGAEKYLTGIASSISATTITKNFTENTIIDTLYKFHPSTWADLAKQFPDLAGTIDTCKNTINRMNFFLGLNIADTPMNIIRTHASIWLVIGAVLIPVLAAASQWISAKLSMEMSQGAAGGADQTAATMKTMNTVMPLMSAFFTLTLPVGMGIYWIASAVIRTIQQIFINRRLEKEDVNELLQKNLEKQKEKMEKKGGVSGQSIMKNATINTKQIEAPENPRLSKARTMQNKAKNLSEDLGSEKKNVRRGSLAERANMVSEYNREHQKK
ncbi:YidC/Oxa1 family membrane protein insertase [Porcincola intestinalis]|uniref:YidC/Oxa1 family membrane protein insertase n=1 Tax=Porcincola intestinalis TaxID=2606632 RepID=A0A6L5XAP9_9FIRM|nr:YidC/Oxa1 family membrane protein insertase [Porcincola intestinalis]MSS15844.1 YidC/Oxa1 family membrane protein insertase [Porcincola intestinalis]